MSNPKNPGFATSAAGYVRVTGPHGLAQKRCVGGVSDADFTSQLNVLWCAAAYRGQDPSCKEFLGKADPHRSILARGSKVHRTLTTNPAELTHVQLDLVAGFFMRGSICTGIFDTIRIGPKRPLCGFTEPPQNLSYV